jgi:hypothetical protein
MTRRKRMLADLEQVSTVRCGGLCNKRTLPRNLHLANSENS